MSSDMKGGSLVGVFDGGALGNDCSCRGAFGIICTCGGGCINCLGLELNVDFDCDADHVVGWDVDCNIWDSLISL